MADKEPTKTETDATKRGLSGAFAKHKVNENGFVSLAKLANFLGGIRAISLVLGNVGAGLRGVGWIAVTVAVWWEQIKAGILRALGG